MKLVLICLATFVAGFLTERVLRAIADALAWEDVRDTGVHLYQQHRRTGRRRVLRGGANQPVDEHWIRTGQWFADVHKPPAPPSRNG